MLELQDGEEYCKMLSSKHAIGIRIMTSQQLWLSARALHKIKPARNLA